MSGRKKELTPEELEARRLKKNERARQYYEAHKEQFREYRLRAELKKYREEKEKGNNGNGN